MSEPVTANDLRKQCRKKRKRQPCFVCGKHQEITELHHILSLRKCASLMNTFETESISIPVVWLCPNCHAYVHMTNSGKIYKIASAVIDESISKEMLKKIADMDFIEANAVTEALNNERSNKT